VKWNAASSGGQDEVFDWKNKIRACECELTNKSMFENKLKI
jgi:hypothetical protein